MDKLKYNVTTWDTGRDHVDQRLGKVDMTVTQGDGFDSSILLGEQPGRTADLFRSAPIIVVEATKHRKTRRGVEWQFPRHADFELDANVVLPPDNSPPRLTFRFRRRGPGWYLVGYVGAPSVDPGETDEIWQPLVWQGRRFPDQSYLTQAFRCSLPATMVRRGTTTISVVADPKELPFQPLPTQHNSRFGVAVRNAEGLAQPLVFAPVLGGPGSRMKPGDELKFSARFVLRAEDTITTYGHVARTLFGCRDVRRNTYCSLNATLENMIDYGMSEYSRFNEDLRGCSYDTDVPGAVKNVSALHPLSLSIIADNSAIYRLRARPIIEYLLSRQKFLFAISPDTKIQNPAWLLKGPCAPLSELAALHVMTGRQNPFLLQLALNQLDKTRVLNLDTSAAWTDVG